MVENVDIVVGAIELIAFACIFLAFAFSFMIFQKTQKATGVWFFITLALLFGSLASFSKVWQAYEVSPLGFELLEKPMISISASFWLAAGYLYHRERYLLKEKMRLGE